MAKKQPGPADEHAQPYEKRPVYRVARDILRETHVHAAHMGKAYKYTMGETLRLAAQGLAESIFLAYAAPHGEEKLKLLHDIGAATHRLLINYRIANDLQQVERRAYVEQIDRIVSMIRQVEKWTQYVQDHAEAGAGRDQSMATTGSHGEPASRAASPVRAEVPA